MPTRLVVLLQSRKSAAAGSGASTIEPASAQPKRTPERVPVRRQQWAWCEFIVVGRSFVVPGAGFHAGRYGLSTSSIDQDSAEIVHVGVGRPRCQKVVKAGEEFGRIVVTKVGGGIEAECAGALEGRVVHIGPGGVVRAAHAAVGAIGIACQAGDAGFAIERESKCQRIFLIRAAPPFAAHRDSQLTA